MSHIFSPLNPVNPLFSIVVTLVALSMASVMARMLHQLPEVGRRNSPLDGLRGFLVIGVFIHHSSIWFFYLKTGKWEVPPSNLYAQFGNSSVALFFMITGFLFFSKLLGSRDDPIDWLKFFLARILRLFPLYIFSVTLLIVIVFCSTGLKLNDSVSNIFLDVLKWLTFTVADAPDLNGLNHTENIIAGVTWSLPYEWLFYLALPLGALALGLKPSKRTLISSVLACIIFRLAMKSHHTIFLEIFGGGIVAAFCTRSVIFSKLCSSALGSCVVLLCFGAVVIFAPIELNQFSILLLSIGFIIIACGNTLFGVLVWRSPRFIGSMSYSIYLLHGIVLFVIFNYSKKIISPVDYSSSQHWLLISISVVPLFIVCYMTYSLIELPCMELLSRLDYFLKSRFFKASKIAELKY